jgi:hypothetical protein
MEKLLTKLGYRKFTASNEPNAIAYQRSYKTYTVFMVSHPSIKSWFCSITFGKTEIYIPKNVTTKWIKDFHESNINL